MRQPVVLKGPGVTSEDVAAAFGISPERQAMIREILANLGYIKNTSGNRKNRPAVKGNKKTASRN
ncbi:MAG: hypothetical protein ACRD4O_08165 [Bryobacteraceae bacterium]